MASNASYSTFPPSSLSSSSSSATLLLPSSASSSTTTNTPSRSPHLTRFLSDFTLGFSDGLTVPFALTAGLSSLGSTTTVIYAGLAELCAGSISMGIGGYLAAVDELPCPPAETSSDYKSGREDDAEEDEEERRRMLARRGSDETVVSERGGMEKLARDEDAVRRYLEPLSLPEETTTAILTNLNLQPGGLSRTAFRLQHQTSLSSPDSDGPLPVSPIASGLSISLGYVIGGIIPLLPYFFSTHVGEGLRWSIGLCLIALFLFGAGKSWVLRREGGGSVKRATFEGTQMMVLGGLAAGSAILCVWLLDSGDGGN